MDNVNDGLNNQTETTSKETTNSKETTKKTSKESKEKKIIRYNTDIGETSFDALSNDKYCVCWTTEARWRKTFRDWYKDHKDECGRFIDEGEFKGAAVTIEIPRKCMDYIRFPKKRNMSDEAKIQAAERMRKARMNKKEY